MSLFRFSLFTGIIETIEQFVGPYITQGIAFLTGLAVWIQAAIIAAAAIFILVGFFTFVKKTYKVLIVLAILGVVGYLLYDQGVLDDIIGGLIPTTTVSTSIIQHILRVLPF